ncbi:MAG TPA: hypothetical protein VL523_04615, partial [Terriglobia bacterium]|nr:hypothetical protein [Terriglobia bacterium]
MPLRSHVRPRVGAASRLIPLCLALVSARLAGQDVEVPPALQNPFTTVTLRADSQQKLGNVYKLTGHAEVSYRDGTLLADQAVYDDS